MRTLEVELPSGGYPIHIGTGIMNKLEELARPWLPAGKRVAVVSDETVWPLHKEKLLQPLKTLGCDVRPVLLPAGEDSKSIPSLTYLYESFAEQGLGRDDLVIAFGGGVMGDVAGFAAATWMRGVRMLQIPTTLLSQVDSSVGGKTAVNLSRGKNLVGAFYQPSAVFIDTGLLSTLERRDWRCGMAEVIKYGAIRSPELFQTLDSPPESQDMEAVVHHCCQIKAEIVGRDEQDRGERMILNFGHTFGHAVEHLGHYHRWNHGEAVAIGMVLAARLGEEIGITQKGTTDSIVKLVECHGLSPHCPCPPTELLPTMRLDKKSGGGAVKLILLKQIGEAVIHEIPFDELEECLERLGN